MNGRTHIYYGMLVLFLVWLGMASYSMFDVNFAFPPFLAYFAGGILGCTFPDFDFIWGDGSARYHRSTWTHSSFIWVIATGFYLFSSDFGLSMVLLFVNLGITTHLWLDMIRSDVPDEFAGSRWTRWQFRWKTMGERKVGGVLKGPFATRNKKGRFLFYNGLVCVVLATILFIKIVLLYDLDLWFR